MSSDILSIGGHRKVLEKTDKNLADKISKTFAMTIAKPTNTKWEGANALNWEKEG